MDTRDAAATVATINWHTTEADRASIEAIADRATLLERRLGYRPDRLGLVMDITAVHANGTPLRLRELLDAPEFDFAHDVFGIKRHLNRRNGQLKDCFFPRFAKAEASR